MGVQCKARLTGGTMKAIRCMTIRFGAVALLIASLFAMGGCSSDYTEDERDSAVFCELGQPAEVTYRYHFFSLEQGPYDLRITPKGITTVQVDGQDVDCVEVEYYVASTQDGEPADFAGCTCAFELLDGDFQIISFDGWYADRNGTRVGTSHDETVPVGEPMTYYVRIPKGLEESGLQYVAVTDRAGVKARSGNIFIYEVG